MVYTQVGTIIDTKFLTSYSLTATYKHLDNDMLNLRLWTRQRFDTVRTGAITESKTNYNVYLFNFYNFK